MDLWKIPAGLGATQPTGTLNQITFLKSGQDSAAGTSQELSYNIKLSRLNYT